MRVFLGTFLEKVYLDHIPFANIEKGFGNKYKPINRNNIHLTWLFIGECFEDRLNKLNYIIEKNIGDFSDLTFTPKKLTLWPPGKPPRLMVLSGEFNGQEELSNRIGELGTGVKEICRPDVKKSFTPHITICRFKKNADISKTAVLPEIKPFTWKVKEVSLIQSVLDPKGSKYSKLANWKV